MKMSLDHYNKLFSKYVKLFPDRIHEFTKLCKNNLQKIELWKIVLEYDVSYYSQIPSELISDDDLNIFMMHLFTYSQSNGGYIYGINFIPKKYKTLENLIKIINEHDYIVYIPQEIKDKFPIIYKHILYSIIKYHEISKEIILHYIPYDFLSSISFWKEMILFIFPEFYGRLGKIFNSIHNENFDDFDEFWSILLTKDISLLYNSFIHIDPIKCPKVVKLIQSNLDTEMLPKILSYLPVSYVSTDFELIKKYFIFGENNKDKYYPIFTVFISDTTVPKSKFFELIDLLILCLPEMDLISAFHDLTYRKYVRDNKIDIVSLEYYSFIFKEIHDKIISSHTQFIQYLCSSNRSLYFDVLFDTYDMIINYI